MVDAHGPDLTGVPFYKMTGSGNDFVFLDGRDARLRALETPDAIRRLCARGTGVGADGVVWLLPPDGPVAYRMRYRNSDGSIAAMCGNASLCSVALAVRLGMAPAKERFRFQADAGFLEGRIRPDGLPEVTLTPVRDVAADAMPAGPGERRIGFADSGVPHAVVLVDDADAVDLAKRGAELRHHARFGQAGANVDFVSPQPGGRWRMRTFERGVEGETLACGTGAAATTALLNVWNLASRDSLTIETTSGQNLVVSIHERDGSFLPALAGEGRLAFEGTVSRL